MLTYKTSKADPTKVRADLIVVGVHEGNLLTAQAKQVDRALNGALKAHLARTRSLGWNTRHPFEGEIKDATSIPSLGKLGAKEVMAVGLGPQKDMDRDQIRRAAGVAGRHSGGYRTVALDLGTDVPGSTQATVEGFELGAYAFSQYKSKQPARTEQVIVTGASDAEIERALIYSRATAWARDLVNESPSAREPAGFTERAREYLKRSGVQVEILEEQDLEKLGMNGILTVGRGSDNPPRLMIMRYSPKKPAGHVGLVGKGITFDSGGLSLKTAEGMETMKLDCSGAAAVVAAMGALEELGVKNRVTGAVALAENMPGGRAAKPGDVIRHYGGHTSEVLNTDAEGRLVLADALAWMAEQQTDVVIDIATLTGGMMVALGMRYAGFFANDRDVADQLVRSSADTGEPLWEMPLVHEYREKLDTPVADIKNISGSRYGAPIYGALFLNDFIGDTRWAHIDIAGPSFSEDPVHYLPYGATGFGTRLLIDFTEAWGSNLLDQDGEE